MRWFIDQKLEKSEGISWIKTFVQRYEIDRLEWIRFDMDKAKMEGQLYPPAGDINFRIACKIPYSFPRTALVHLPPIYQNEDGSWPLGVASEESLINEKTGIRWVRQYGKQEIVDQDEAVVWAFTKAAYGWLKGTGQIFGSLNKIEADAFAKDKVRMFKKEMGILS